MSRHLGRKPPNPPERQLLVDVSQLVLHDYKTGIQRVVRSVLSELLAHPPAGFRVEPVYAKPHQPGFFYARAFLHRIGRGPEVPDAPTTVAKGDVFLGLDLNHQAVLTQPALFEALRRAGVKVCSVVYDLLPILMPKAFHGLDGASHARWLSSLAEMDGLVCISRAVADEALAWLEAHGPQRVTPLPVGWFHLGADLGASIPTRGIPQEAEAFLQELRRRPTFLMVATLEPRKGHRQVMEAFDRLWARGRDANLLFVGREGWSVEKLIHQLRHTHPERNQRLFWIEGASDDYLETLYAASSCLIAASEGEGFGLPLIEAAQHHLPILARDIPVFREVAGEHAFYFSGLDPESLADRIEDWLRRSREGTAPGSDGLRWLTWKESARDLMQVVLEGRWYKTWTPPRQPPKGKAPLRAPSSVSAAPWERAIGVDGRTLCLPGSTQRGIGHYTVHHLQALAGLTPRWLYRLFLDAPDFSDWGLDRLRALPNVEILPFDAFRAEGHDLVHVPDPMTLDPHPAWAKPRAEMPTTAVFYDLIPFLFRKQFLDRWPPKAREDYARRIETLKQSPATILTISEHTRRDLVTHLDFQAERLVPISAGLNQEAGPAPPLETVQRVLAEWGLKGPFFLVVGALDHHKRFDISLQAFAQVRQSQPIQLVVVGTLDHPMARAYRDQFREQDVHSILFTGFLPRVELECLYRSATALLFPSAYEGFGFPVLEAMAQGCPVITTTASSLPEVAGDGALLVPPGDAEAMAKAMQSLLEDDALRKDLQRRGAAQAHRFTWDAVARKTLDVWQSLWESARSSPQADLPRETAPCSVRWEGSQFVWHSLAHVNRQVCLGLLRDGSFDLSLIPYEADQFHPANHPGFLPLASRINRAPAGPVGVHVRHQWPPQFAPPLAGCWVMIQPWEYGGLPQSWIGPMNQSVDEVWVYTAWLRDRYIESGVARDKVVVIPLGVDTDRFHPEGPAFPLHTLKAFRFLFVGGIIPRKGIDILLRAYRQTFSASDDVCLVIKAQGGGVYAGSELREAIDAHRKDPGAPALEFLEQDLSEPDLAALYRSCQAFVMPYRGEGFGLPIAEAMASGLPVIVTGRGAAMDFTHGDWAYRIPSHAFPLPRVDALLPGPAGFWLEEPDGQALAECMAWVAAHPEEAKAKGALARAHAEAHLGWEGPVQRVAERLKVLAQRRPLRYRTDAPPPPAPAATALIYAADWSQAEWAEVVLSYLTAFPPGEPVALVLPLPRHGQGPGQAAVERRVVDLAGRAGKTSFPDIVFLGPEDDVEEALRPYLIRETVPSGRGAIHGLRSLAGLRFAHARKQLTGG